MTALSPVELRLKAMLETGEGLSEGEALYGFIMPDGVTLITKVPRQAGVHCQLREWEGLTLMVGPSDESLLLMHRDNVKAVVDELMRFGLRWAADIAANVLTGAVRRFQPGQRVVVHHPDGPWEGSVVEDVSDEVVVASSLAQEQVKDRNSIEVV